MRDRMVVRNVIDAGPGTASQLFGAERGDIYEQKAIRHNGRRLAGFGGVDFLWLNSLEFHNGLGYCTNA